MTGYVYAIESGDAVKIGWAQNPVRRLSELNVGSPGQHRLLGFVGATKDQERQLHRLFAPYRIRGEWFRHEGIVAIAVAEFTPYRPAPCIVRTPICDREPLSIGMMQALLNERLAALATAFIAATGWSNSAVWNKSIKDSRFFDRVQAGHSFGVRTYDRIVRWFADNWPPDVSWPEPPDGVIDIARPQNAVRS
jgi:Meiotically up-regulated gene 113